MVLIATAEKVWYVTHWINVDSSPIMIKKSAAGLLAWRLLRLIVLLLDLIL